MLCLSQKIVLLFTLKTISGLLASSARQDGDIQKIPTNVYSMNDKFTRFQFLVNVLSGTFLAPPPTLPSSFYNPLFYCVNFLIKLFLKNQRFSFASWEANFSGMDTVLTVFKYERPLEAPYRGKGGFSLEGGGILPQNRYRPSLDL